MITSILDTDLYKISMGQVVAHRYPHIEVSYEFINRGKTKFPDGFAKQLRQAVDAMQGVVLSAEEERFLRDKCYYLRPNYIDMLRGYRFDPRQVNIRQLGSELFITVTGPWYLSIFWEVPLLAMVSELYYAMTDQPPVSGWEERLVDKTEKLAVAGCLVSEFGTRRRHSRAVQETVISVMKQYSCLVGTSNVHLAHIHNLSPHGTMAHEFISAHACLFGYRMATSKMLEAWVDVFGGELGTALPDTFTTPVFLRDFSTLYAKLFDGVRQDSGNWKEFTDSVIEHYKKLRINPLTKTIVYSDGLDVDTVLKIHEYAKGKINDRFGIGTSLTNDVGRTPLNIVIKLTKCNGVDAVKLSDSPGKELGSSEAVSHCKYSLGLQ